ncbi:putative membrane protein [Streptomyces turgidiscabies Car8]|uniref:Putative membrane protein n=2 Tax=Streptomyces turgidiscabies TaxID=85558 RepID=L7FG52_STRT8|nr:MULTISPECIES: hypothetical protein [Streptomyces]ELP70144.1 putative membrane protein [Streptomyces turgidiscabies Car8]
MTFTGEPTNFTPDTCVLGTDGIDWSSIASAEAMSAFCGIMAGFVLAGLVTVIGQKNAAGGDGHASRGLKLFLPCFIGLATASYLYALTSGELVCTRAITEQLFSGAILAADALIVIVALAWLLPAYERNKHGEVRFFRGLIQVAAQFSMLMVIVSADGFTNSVLEQHVAGWATALVYSVGAAFMVAILFFWWKRLPPAPPPPTPLPNGVTAAGWPAHWRDEIHLNRRVQVAARAAVAVGGLLAVAGGCVVGIAWYHWTSMSPWLVYTLAGVTLVLPGLVITTAVRSAPRA